MASSLPLYPRVLFTIIEPIALLAGAIGATYDSSNFVASQLPSTWQKPASYTLTPTNRVIVYQLGNMFGLTGMIALGIFYGTTELKVIRNFLIACAIGDVGHIVAVYTVMGQRDFLAIQDWNTISWGSIGFTVLLFASRILYLFGAFGDGKSARGKRQKSKRKGQ